SVPTPGSFHGARSIVPPAVTSRDSIASTSGAPMYVTMPGNPAGAFERRAAVGPPGATTPASSAENGWICQPNSVAQNVLDADRLSAVTTPRAMGCSPLPGGTFGISKPIGLSPE